jgi:hypothetical protein
MALTGTLKDFGIAEILQLIGQQAKSGVLHLASRDEQIHISMSEGAVVRAESSGRKAREKLGTMLVRAEIITPAELQVALDLQKRTLRRLGDILVDQGFVSAEDLREMTALQTTETVYRLFAWKSGTYAFEAGEVEWDPASVAPLRAESVLMEGFRQVDEWPLIRRRISSTAVTFRRLRPLEVERTTARMRKREEEVDAAFAALEAGEPGAEVAEDGGVGRTERRVYELAEPERPLQRIIDLSRLGEFETCKALLTLINQGYLATAEPARVRATAVGSLAREWPRRLRAGVLGVAATLAIAAALAGVAAWVDERGLAWGDQRAGSALRDNAARRFLARYQLARLRGALEVYRLERGDYPERLEELKGAGLAGDRDLRYPWSREYHYRRTDGAGFVLLPPVE